MTPLQKIIADLQDLMARPVNDGELPFPDAVDAIHAAYAAGLEAAAKVVAMVEVEYRDDGRHDEAMPLRVAWDRVAALTPSAPPSDATEGGEVEAEIDFLDRWTEETMAYLRENGHGMSSEDDHALLFNQGSALLARWQRKPPQPAKGCAHPAIEEWQTAIGAKFCGKCGTELTGTERDQWGGIRPTCIGSGTEPGRGA